MPNWTVDLFPQVEEFLNGLAPAELARVSSVISLLEQAGSRLPEPHSKLIRSPNNWKLRELRIRYGQHCYRILYAFDTRRHACLLVAADKAEYGFEAFYDDHVSTADRLMKEHEQALKAKAQASESERGKVAKRQQPGKVRKRKRGPQ